MKLKITLGAAALCGLAACIDGGSGGGTPSIEEQACLAAVSRTTSNGDVSVLSSEFSQAGTSVTVGVGPDRAPWKCIAYGDGTTGEIMSLTDEGAL
jgi:hypothetical protein